jgi:hypothetical protein
LGLERKETVVKKLTDYKGTYYLGVESSEVVEFIQMEPVHAGSDNKGEALAFALQKAEMQSGEDLSDQGYEVSGYYLNAYGTKAREVVNFTEDEVREAQNLARLELLVD